MFGSVVLDVAIGLILLFLFASLVCAAIREAIETVLNARSADLEQGLRDMLDAPEQHANTAALFAHPLIYPLYRGDYRPARLRPRRTLAGAPAGLRMDLPGRASLPAYIPPRAFAQAFLDLQGRGPLGAAGHPAPPLTVALLRARTDAMPDTRTRRILLVALDEAGHGDGQGDGRGDGRELAGVERAVMRWFDGCMGQLSRLYRRRTQRMLFLIGFGAAAAMNIDAFSVGRALFQDGALRDGAVAQATALLSQAPPDAATPDATPDAAAPDAAASDTTASDAAASGGQVAARAVSAFSILQGELGRIRFPTGWNRPLPQALDTPGHVLQVLAGWLVTAFAVMLGAPFWFDLLGRFVAARQAGAGGSSGGSGR